MSTEAGMHVLRERVELATTVAATTASIAATTTTTAAAAAAAAVVAAAAAAAAVVLIILQVKVSVKVTYNVLVEILFLAVVVRLFIKRL